MAAAFQVLRWTPAVFWAATPRELSAALHGIRGEPSAPFGRDVLAALMNRYPDRLEP